MASKYRLSRPKTRGSGKHRTGVGKLGMPVSSPLFFNKQRTWPSFALPPIPVQGYGQHRIYRNIILSR